MGRTTSENWFNIDLDEPSFIIPDPSSTLSHSSTSDSQHDRLTGTITLNLSKQTKVKSLTFTFTGYAKSSFYFDSSSIPEAKPCVSCDRNSYECMLVEHKETVLSCESKRPHILPIGTHKFPFSIKISEHLPKMFTSRAIIINYQVEASLQLLSILPFGSHYHAAKPVILLQKDELPSDSLFNTIPLRAYSKASHVSSEAIIPCAVFPQAGIIPIDLNLVLHGNATTVTKMAIELVENIYITPLDENNKAVLIDERVVSRQNCPISNWPSSSSSDPVTILKRLMFKVPQPAHFTCSDSTEALELSCSRSALKRGFCHPSGILANTKLKITHTFRTVVNVRGLSETGNSPVQDSGESETTVWITGNQEYKDEDGDDTNPPSYIRSFSTKLVDKEKIREIDQLAMEALQNDLPLNVSPPCYEDSPAESSTSSTSSSPTLSSWICHSRPSMDRFSLDESRSSHDTYVFDLAAYAERNSRPAVLAM